MTDLETKIVAAIRHDPLIGWGTCSSVDECMEDEEIISHLKEMKKLYVGSMDPLASVAAGLKEMRAFEGIRMEYGQDIRDSGDCDSREVSDAVYELAAKLQGKS